MANLQSLQTSGQCDIVANDWEKHQSWSEEALNKQNMLEMCASLLPMSLANWRTREALILTLKNKCLRGVGSGMGSVKWKKSVGLRFGGGALERNNYEIRAKGTNVGKTKKWSKTYTKPRSQSSGSMRHEWKSTSTQHTKSTEPNKIPADFSPPHSLPNNESQVKRWRFLCQDGLDPSIKKRLPFPCSPQEKERNVSRLGLMLGNHFAQDDGGQ